MAITNKTFANQLRKLGEYNKALVATLGGVLIVVNQAAGVVHGSWSTGVLAALTAVTVLLTRNQQTIDSAGDFAAEVIDR